MYTVNCWLLRELKVICIVKRVQLSTWRRGSVVRMSVCSRQTFPDLRLIHG